MKQYKRIMLGSKSIYSEECLRGNFIGADYGFKLDLSNRLPDNWKDFNKEFIPFWLNNHPDKSKIAAGLACGNLWVVCKGINQGDLVLAHNGKGEYNIGEVLSDYYYQPEEILPHRRKVRWFSQTVPKEVMSSELKGSLNASGTVIDISRHAEEIEALIVGKRPAELISTDETVEDPTVFALEKHLEDFLVSNWQNTELGKKYDIYEEDGELVGKQYPCDTGPLDILAISKDRKTLLVVELKKGRASDYVVGQIQRYMGYVKEELAEKNQNVKGVIIALEDDLRIKRALSVATNIDFYRYEITFQLKKI